MISNPIVYSVSVDASNVPVDISNVNSLPVPVYEVIVILNPVMAQLMESLVDA